MISWFLPEIMGFTERERRGAGVAGKRMGSALGLFAFDESVERPSDSIFGLIFMHE